MAVTYNRTGVSVVSSGSTGGATGTPDMPNYGVSVISGSTLEVYTLAPPVAGCRKTIIINQYSTTVLNPSIRLSSGGAQTISIMGASTNVTYLKASAARSTVFATVIELLGISSTQWALINAFPTVAVATGSTGVGGMITASST